MQPRANFPDDLPKDAVSMRFIEDLDGENWRPPLKAVKVSVDPLQVLMDTFD